MKTIFQTLAATALLAFASGCNPGEPGEAEPIEEAALPVFESTCTSVTADATISSGQTAHSPDDQYDHSTNCPHQYVIEVTGTFSLIEAGWDQPIPDNQTDCENARWLKGWFKKDSGVWDTSVEGTYEASGTWNGTCTWATMAGFPTGTWTGLSGHQAMRMVIQNWVWVDSKPDFKFAYVHPY